MIGEVLGSYVVVRKLGEGGMGAVYLAQHQHIARRAAIKLLRPDLAHREALIDRFFTEARATSLIRHPGIVEILDCAVSDHGAYIVMELLEGESLGAFLARHGRFAVEDLATAARIGEGIASAVGAAHAAQIIHRDLKPDNVFLARQPSGEVAVKILDFGIAKLADGESAHRTSTGVILGTPVYMSPEQCRAAGKVDARTDIYSLGCVLYELVTGRPPFVKEGSGELIAAHLNEVPALPSVLVGGVPPELERLIVSMLAKSPDDRPATMVEVASRLHTLRGPVADDQPLLMPAASPAAATTRRDRDDLPRTAVLAPASPATVRLSPPRPRLTTLGASAHAVEVPGARTAPLRPRRRLAMAGGLVAVVAVVGLVVTTQLGPRRPHAPPPPTTGAAVAPEPAVAAAPALGWVTVEIEGAPAGLTATIGGRAAGLPLRLPKGSGAVPVVLVAPGHEPRTVTVDGSRDRSLVLEWPGAAPARRAPAGKKRASAPSAPGSSAVPPPADPPAAKNPLDMTLQ